MTIDEFVEKYKTELGFCGNFLGKDDDEMLEEAFDMLDNYIEHYKVLFRLDQLKTKFGGLRLYWHIEEDADLKHFHFIEGAVNMLENLWRDG